jgi:hypothetical protein
MLIGFVVAIAAIAGVSAGVTGLTAVAGRPARCPASQPCGAPPALTQPLINELVFRSPQLGFTFEYPGDLLKIDQQSSSMVGLSFANGSGELLVASAPAARATPTAGIAAEVAGLKGRLSGLARDTQPQDALLGANVGYRPGTGEAFVGTLAGPQGASQTSAIAVQSATDGRLTVTVTALVFNAQDREVREDDYQLGDAVFNTIQWLR